MKLTPTELTLEKDHITVAVENDRGVEFAIGHAFGTTEEFAEALENSASMIRLWLARDE